MQEHPLPSQSLQLRVHSSPHPAVQLGIADTVLVNLTLVLDTDVMGGHGLVDGVGVDVIEYVSTDGLLLGIVTPGGGPSVMGAIQNSDGVTVNTTLSTAAWVMLMLKTGMRVVVMGAKVITVTTVTAGDAVAHDWTNVVVSGLHEMVVGVGSV